jgi:hypothetical protein
MPQRSARHLREAGAAAKFLRTGSAICAVHESAFGTKRTSRDTQPMSAFGGKADIGATPPSHLKNRCGQGSAQRLKPQRGCDALLLYRSIRPLLWEGTREGGADGLINRQK